jgi:2-keto-4-pentenoate hydratase
LSEQDDAISRSLVNARLKAEPLPDFPGQLPETLEQAYAIQSANIERWPDEIGGWKVAGLSPADQARLGAERLSGPVFRSRIHTVENGGSIVVPVYEGGFAAVEAEVVFRLGAAVPPTDKNYSDEELASLVAAAYCGAEIASSPMAVVNERGPTSVVSDFGNNAHVLIGPEIPDWQSLPPSTLKATVTVDDVVVGESVVDSISSGNPLGALRRLVEICARRGIELPAGTIVSTGAITGVHDVKLSSTSRVDYGDFGGFDVTYKPIEAVPADQG